MALSKMQELAQRARATRENFDKQAEELLAEHDDLRRAGEESFAKLREHHKAAQSDIDAIREMLSDAPGSNSKNEEGSSDLAGDFQGKSDV